MTLAHQMKDVCQFIEKQFEKFTDPDDAHLTICQLTADQFQLWEPMGDGEGFPLWLSFVVQGIGRDAGILI